MHAENIPEIALFIRPPVIGLVSWPGQAGKRTVSLTRAGGIFSLFGDKLARGGSELWHAIVAARNCGT